MSIYSQIDSNKRRTWLVMAGFIVFVSVVAWVFSQAMGYGNDLVPLALIFSGITSFSSFYFSDSVVLSLSGAKEVTDRDEPEFVHAVENLAIASGLPKPKSYVIEDSAPNAFATGRDPRHVVICATRGLLNMIDKSELEGVIAHELSHIKDYDTRLMAIVAVFVGSVAILADWFTHSMFWGGRDDRESRNSRGIFMILAVILAILSPIIATLIQLAISRRREFLADANAAYLTRFPNGLADALEKLNSSRRTGSFASTATAHLFIVNPFKGKDAVSWLSGLFSTHPPIEERVALLRKM